MKRIFPIIFLSITIVSCQHAKPTIYRSTASLPHQATAVQTRMTLMSGSENNEVDVFAAVDKVKGQDIYYIILSPINRFVNASKHDIKSEDIEHAVSLLPDDARELIETINSIDESSQSSGNGPTFIRFLNKTQMPIIPTSIAADDEGHIAVKVESISTPVWVPSVELIYTKTEKERWTKLMLYDGEKSDSFMFAGQKDLLSFRDRIISALAELSSQGMAVH